MHVENLCRRLRGWAWCVDVGSAIVEAVSRVGLFVGACSSAGVMHAFNAAVCNLSTFQIRMGRQQHLRENVS